METVKEPAGVKAPWIKNLGDVPAHLEYPDCSMYENLERCAEKYPNLTAYVFMGRKTTYRTLLQEVNLCARALKAIGIRSGDRVTIAMPNCPQGVIMFYAVNLVGAIANMIHPLSSEKEIEFYLKESVGVHLRHHPGPVLPQVRGPSARTWTWTTSSSPPSRTP